MFITFNIPKLNKDNYISRPSFRAVPAKSGMVKDIFTRTTEPDFLSLPKKEIFATIQRTLLNPKNKMGKGGEANVWEIENTGYCIRIPFGSEDEIFSEFNTELTNDDKANHITARLGGNATIMKIIPGLVFQNLEHAKKIDLPTIIENMPVKAFKELFVQIKTAETSTDLSFDSGYNNIIINPNNQSLTAIDFYKSEDSLFKNQIFSGIFSSLMFNKITTIEQQKTCLGKLILAALELNKSNPELRPFESGFHRMIDQLAQSNDTKIIDNPKYFKIIKDCANKLQQNPRNIGTERILVTLVKQLFGVKAEYPRE